MKILKYLFYIILLIALGGALYIYTIDGTFQLEESKVIDAPDELLFTTINDFKTWEKWGPWMDDSDDMIIEYTAKTSGQGASYSWKSETQGNGNMKTIKTLPFSSIDQSITFYPPFIGETTSNVYWKFEKIDRRKTKVTWGMKGEQGFLEKMFWMTQDSSLSKNLKPMYKRGLEKLETFTTKKMKEYSINVDGVTEHKGAFYMYSATASTIDAIPQKIAQIIPTVKAYISQNNLPQTGMPFTLYNEFNEEQGTAIYSIGIPIREKVVTPSNSNILCNSLPKQKVVKTTLKGDYIHLKETWEAAHKYINDNGLEILNSSPSFEVYRASDDVQPNPAEWVTEIYIPIK